jgi:uncharacterized protein (DUF433 family)
MTGRIAGRQDRFAAPAEMTYLKVVTTEQKASLASVVSVDPAIMHGTPCFAGTRVPVQTLLDYIEEGDTIDSFLNDFSTVSREQTVSFLELAKDQLIECVSS